MPKTARGHWLAVLKRAPRRSGAWGAFCEFARLWVIMAHSATGVGDREAGVGDRETKVGDRERGDGRRELGPGEGTGA
eukprot:356121-Chlamydomonas_euryale.AAC.8